MPKLKEYLVTVNVVATITIKAASESEAKDLAQEDAAVRQEIYDNGEIFVASIVDESDDSETIYS